MTETNNLLRSTRWLAIVAAATLAMTREIEGWYLLIFSAFYLLGFQMQKRGVIRAMKVIQPLLALFFFAFAVADFLYFSRSFLLSVAHFLLMIQGTRFLSMTTSRENLGSVLLSSLMVLSGSTLAIDWTFFAMLLVFVVLVIWTLLLYTVQHEAENQNESMRVPLYSLRPFRRATLMAFLVTISCCAVVFTVFPRFNFRGFKGQYLQPVHKTGMTEQVSLSGEGKIFVDESVAMRVEMSLADKDMWDGYLKGSTLDVFDGENWKKSSTQGVQIFRSGRETISIPFRKRVEGRLIHYGVFLESMDSPLLFAAAIPIRLKIDRPYLVLGRDFSVSRTNGDTWRLHYEVDSMLPLEKKRRTFSKEYGLLAKTGNPEDPIYQLAMSIAGRATSPRQAAEQINAYLQANYTYTLALDKGKGGSPVKTFLLETKKGHCEYFASSLCVLLNQFRIPTRLVTGFLAQEWNNRGNYYVVRMKDAHAWVEVYLGEEEGWVAFDPTPRGARIPVFREGWTRKITESMDYLNLRWNRYILSYDMDRQVQMFQTINEGSRRLTVSFGHLEKMIGNVFKRFQLGKSKEGKSESEQNSSGHKITWIVFSGLGLIICLFMFRYLISRFSNPSRVWFYPLLIKRLEKMGGKKPPQQTLAEFVASLSVRLGDKQENVQFLTNEYYRRRFSPLPTSPRKEEKKIRHLLKSI
jgi:protein-glutamine gamma-glutamyltransferase